MRPTPSRRYTARWMRQSDARDHHCQNHRADPRDILDDDAVVLTEATTAADVPGWDSFNHINLVVAVEKSFGVRFRTHEIENLRNVGEFVDMIQARLDK